MRFLRDLISQRLGIQVRCQDLDRLERTLSERCERLQLSDLAEYSAFLQAPGQRSDREWEQLASLLTTGETFFFRGRAHTEVLRSEILPELMRNRGQQRSLRIWSAGCSTGEEAYSIAIMLDELKANGNDWSISLLATDINLDAIAKARRGVYSDWSFRQVDPAIRQKYFRKLGNKWELDERIKKLVTFEPLNLLTDVFPSKLARDMDLILCRNVFIYFSEQDVASIVSKFAATLRPGGFLLTGHGELQGQKTDPLVKRVFSESIVLQREDASPPASMPGSASTALQVSTKPTWSDSPSSASVNAMAAATATPQPNLPPQVEPSDDSIEQIEELYKQGFHAVGLEKAMRMISKNPGDARVCCLIAEGHADLGNHKQAIDWCQQAMQSDAFSVKPQYLLANIAEAEGRYDDAKAFLRKVIYLNPSHIAAQLALAGLYQREGDLRLAEKTRLALVEMLKSKPDSSPIECHEALTVGELVQQLNQAVRHG